MASESNFMQVVIPHFDGHYDHWSMLMKNFLRSKEYWPIVEDIIGTPAEGEVLTNVQKTEFKARKLKALKAKYYLFQMKDGKLVTSYCSRTMEISSKIQFHDEKMNDATIVENILRSLTPKYEYVMNCSSTFEEQALKASTFISTSSRGRGRGREEGKEIEETKIEATNMVAGIAEPMMTTTKAEEDILINLRLPIEKGENSNFTENKEGETL
ncbi:hypothetical protein KY284_035560 [Solanum tuberosum]|nr:hypothetical protein KY284_035560 [Solanum tuberosum]